MGFLAPLFVGLKRAITTAVEAECCGSLIPHKTSFPAWEVKCTPLTKSVNARWTDMA